jgi:hypothetical protein
MQMESPDIIIVYKDERHFASDTRQRFSLYRGSKFTVSVMKHKKSVRGQDSVCVTRDAHRNKLIFTCAGFCDIN